MIVPINEAGKYGMIVDVAPHELPPNAWSYAKNMHFPENYAEKVSGHEDSFGTPGCPPYFTVSVRNASEQFWVYGGANKVYAYDTAATHTDISRAVGGAYAATFDKNWHGGSLNGIVVLNNGVDTPQMWNPVVKTQALQALTAWPANTLCGALRSYKNYLVALDITKSGTRDPRLVKWSHTAAAGAVPTSWDETDPTKDAGEYSIADTDGYVIDSLPMRDLNIIYKDDSIWGMQYIGGNSIFRFTQLFNNAGVIGRDCVSEFQIGKHVVFAKDDLLVHDGQAVSPILRGKNRSWLYNNIDPVYYKRSFLTLDPGNREVWFCFPETGHSLPSLALIWNWNSNSWGVRELDNISHVGIGAVKPTATTDLWSDASTWDGDPAQWGESTWNPSISRLLMCAPVQTKLLGVLGNSQFSGVNMSAILERKGLGIPFNTTTPPDTSSMKFCSNIWPRITGTVGTTVWVEIGGQMNMSEDPVWAAPQPFVIGTTEKIDCTVTGRLFGIRFSSTGNLAWKLQGYDLDVRKLGNY
jgi:hypothetical protein